LHITFVCNNVAAWYATRVKRWLTMALGSGALLHAGCRGDAHESAHATSVAASSTQRAPAASATVALVAPSATGVDACDRLFAATVACAAKPTADRTELGDTIEQYQTQLRAAQSDIARQSVAIGCAAAERALADDPRCQ
jgi:hypothetical protein